MTDKVFVAGDRVLVYDYTLFKNDVDTPSRELTKPATVVRWYGRPETHYKICDMRLGPYPSLIDVVFDHRPQRESCGHFTDHVEHCYGNRSNVTKDCGCTTSVKGKNVACEKCWGDAYLRMRLNGRGQADNYRELLEERKDNPCTHDEQDGVETLDCGCKVIKGWRCPVHNAP